MALKLVTAPAEEPVTLAEAKLHLRETETALDALIQSLIVAATAHAEDFTGRRLVTQTWDYFLDAFPCWGIAIPYPPLASITSIKYVDTEGVEQTLASSEYLVDVKSSPGRVTPAYGKTWPSIRSQMNAVTIRFVAGYGLHAAVPEKIRNACLLHIEAHHNRDEKQMATLIQAAENLMRAYCLYRF
ncbi:MAG TPA: phage head-tail connector protein [Burkholderiales bacterium]|nr:phage head-tail connector protein [Burkholderiales bacterium]